MTALRVATFALLTVALAIGIIAPNSARSQPAIDKATIERAEKQRAEAANSLSTLAELLVSRKQQADAIAKLKEELRKAKEDVTKKEMETAIKAETEKLAQIDAQISALSTGVAEDEIKYDQSAKFNLQAELESLIQPFIKMMRDATENARQIDRLKNTIAVGEQRQRAANRATTRLNLLLSLEKQSDNKEADTKPEKTVTETSKHLADLLKTWRKREQEAQHLLETARQQLQLRENQQANAPSGIGTYATKYFSDRGQNLFLGLFSLGAVFGIMNLIARLADYIRRRYGIDRSFASRLINLMFRVGTVVIAFLAMLAVFNYLNDWLLMGVASIFILAGAWVGVKMLPQIIEQVTLLLDLGAVQENERVLLGGVPWRVERLDFYTDLVNPALDGGTFTVPVRELVGLHSRPAAEGEAWFPTRKNDWVQLEDGHIGRVVSQTPELVQVVELGGARRTFETTAFLADAPRNLSTGYRIKTEFGLDYRHQAIATREIPDKLRQHVHAGLVELLGEKAIENVDVDLLRTDDSAIIFEIETDIEGKMAHRYEDVERAVAHLMVDAANEHGWAIPYPQMVLHRG